MQVFGPGAQCLLDALSQKLPDPGFVPLNVPVHTHLGSGKVVRLEGDLLHLEGGDAASGWHLNIKREQFGARWKTPQGEAQFVQPLSPCGYGTLNMRCVLEPSHDGPHIFHCYS